MTHMLRDTTALVLAVVGLVSLPLYRGGYADWPQIFSGICFCLSLMAGNKQLTTSSPIQRFSIVLWLCWIFWQILQCIPLPDAVLSILAPKSLQFWHDIAAAGIPSRPSISLTPIISQQQTVVCVGYFCLYLSLKTSLNGSHTLARRFMVCIICIGGIQAAYGTIAHLSEWQLAWLEPSQPAHLNVAHGSFPNRNHFAAFLIPAFGCAMALLVAPQTQHKPSWKSRSRNLIDVLNGPAPILRLAILIIVVAIVLSRSRMGNGAFVVGFSTFAFLWLLHAKTAKGLGKTILLLGSIAAIDVLIVSERFGLGQVLERIEDTDMKTEGRAEASTISLALIGRHMLSGAGYGSYAKLEHSERSGLRTPSFVHAHNDHLELVIEFGLIGYCILALLLAAHIVMALQLLNANRQFKRACGAMFLMVVAAALVHATVEFIFHIPAYSALFVSLMALTASMKTKTESKYG